MASSQFDIQISFPIEAKTESRQNLLQWSSYVKISWFYLESINSPFILFPFNVCSNHLLSLTCDVSLFFKSFLPPVPLHLDESTKYEGLQ